MIQHRKTFREVLEGVSPQNALALEKKARSASWLAKKYPSESRAFYRIKHQALAQLFHIENQAPTILECSQSGHTMLLSLCLRRTRALLHVPFGEMKARIKIALPELDLNAPQRMAAQGTRRVLSRARQRSKNR